MEPKIWQALPCKCKVVHCPFLFSGVYCLTSLVVQTVVELQLLKCSYVKFEITLIEMLDVWNVRTPKVQAKACTVSCQLCTATLWHLHESEAPSALNCKSLVGSHSIDSFYFEQTSTDGFCNRVHYCKSGFVGLSGFENKAYWVCIYHLLLLFMTNQKLAKFLAIYLDPWQVIFWLYLNCKPKFCCLVWKAALYRATLRNNHCVAQLCAIFKPSIKIKYFHMNHS